MKRLEVNSLRARRGTFLIEVPELWVDRGEIVALSGPSGSGKTTLLEAIAGFQTLESGSIRVDGQGIERLAPEKRRVGIVFQRAALFPHLNVEENVAFGLRLAGMPKSERTAKAREWLDRVSLGGYGGRKVTELSEGQAQRVALARAVAVEFPVLLLDEPFSALDAATRGDLSTRIKSRVKELGIATLLVSHQHEDVQALADRVIRQENGVLKS